jgi:hypothetical protein
MSYMAVLSAIRADPSKIEGAPQMNNANEFGISQKISLVGACKYHAPIEFHDNMFLIQTGCSLSVLALLRGLEPPESPRWRRGIAAPLIIFC